MKNIAVLLMGGKGERMHLSVPKQYLLIDKKPLYIYPLLTFFKTNYFDEIILVLSFEYYEKIKEDIKIYFGVNNRKISLIKAGTTRESSLYNALYYINQQYNAENIRVVTHDVARAFISDNLIKKHVETDFDNEEVLNTYLPSSDSLLEIDINNEFKTLNRDFVFAIQTPQTFYSKFMFDLIQANKEKWKMYHDVASFAIACDKKIKQVLGETNNFKITRKEDLNLLHLLHNN